MKEDVPKDVVTEDHTRSKYVKIIGKNFGNYPYRVGINTLKYNNETFNPSKECHSGGLYFTTVNHIFDFAYFGNQVCIITLPEKSVYIRLGNKFKSDRICIEKIMPLWDLGTIQYLLSIGANIDDAFTSACRYGHLNIVTYLVSVGANIHTDGGYALQSAAGQGHLNIVKYLVSMGANIMNDGNYGLRLASSNGHLTVVKYLISMGADIHTDQGCCLQQAARNGHLDVVQYLVSLGIDIHVDNDYALRLASENQHTDIVRYLISRQN